MVPHRTAARPLASGDIGEEMPGARGIPRLTRSTEVILETLRSDGLSVVTTTGPRSTTSCGRHRSMRTGNSSRWRGGGALARGRVQPSGKDEQGALTVRQRGQLARGQVIALAQAEQGEALEETNEDYQEAA